MGKDRRIGMNCRTGAPGLASALTLALCILPDTAFACSCRPVSAAEHVARSDFIFRGRVVDKMHDGGLLNPLSRGQRIVFEISRTWKGPDPKRLVVHVRSTSEAACGYRFRLGWSGMVFARLGENGEPTVSLCQMISYRYPVDETGDYDSLLPGHGEQAR
jgi:hypothetical protein